MCLQIESFGKFHGHLPHFPITDNTLMHCNITGSSFFDLSLKMDLTIQYNKLMANI
jgi:hypothetical protein